jgi:hypothetical protein
MAGYGIAIRMAEAEAAGVQPDGVVTFSHHLTDWAQVSAGPHQSPAPKRGGCSAAGLPGRADLGAGGGLPEQCSQLAALPSGELRTEVPADRLPVDRPGAA